MLKLVKNVKLKMVKSDKCGILKYAQSSQDRDQTKTDEQIVKHVLKS